MAAAVRQAGARSAFRRASGGRPRACATPDAHEGEPPCRRESPSRRRALAGLGAAGAASAAGLGGEARAAAGSKGVAPPLTAQWTATAGLNSDGGLVSFEESAYASMRDDEQRTSGFARAIARRLGAAPAGTLAVLDIGTGPYALLALQAARNGARKVYAVEAEAEVAARAREAVAAEEVAGTVAAGVVEVIQGLSTDVTLPEKVDLVLAEIVGSVASEEGLFASVLDAQARHVKEPHDPSSWIPAGCQTLCAPASFALHSYLAPPVYQRLGGVPVRLNCRDETVQLLSEPQVMEDIRFYDPDLPRASARVTLGPFAFPVDAERVDAGRQVYRDALIGEGAPEEEADALSAAVAGCFSGLALFPRVMLDEGEGGAVVYSRGPRGEPAQSHWQTVLALMSPVPVPVSEGDVLKVAGALTLGNAVTDAPRYSLAGKLVDRDGLPVTFQYGFTEGYAEPAAGPQA